MPPELRGRASVCSDTPYKGRAMAKRQAVIYWRWSPRKRTDTTSGEVQLAACRQYCAERGYRVVGEFGDTELSGGDVDRPGLWDSVAAVPRGGVLVVAKLDRLARSVQLDGYIRHKLSKLGATVEAADGSSEDDTPEAVMLRQMLAVIAEYSKQIGAARTRAAMLHNQASGRAMSKLPPYGWARVGKLLEAVPAEQAGIASVLSMHRAGLGLRAIARELDVQGVPCRGAKWRHSTVLAIIRRSGVFSPVQSCLAVS